MIRAITYSSGHHCEALTGAIPVIGGNRPGRDNHQHGPKQRPSGRNRRLFGLHVASEGRLQDGAFMSVERWGQRLAQGRIDHVNDHGRLAAILGRECLSLRGPCRVNFFFTAACAPSGFWRLDRQRGDIRVFDDGWSVGRFGCDLDVFGFVGIFFAGHVIPPVQGAR